MDEGQIEVTSQRYYYQKCPGLRVASEHRLGQDVLQNDTALSLLFRLASCFSEHEVRKPHRYFMRKNIKY